MTKEEISAMGISPDLAEKIAESFSQLDGENAALKSAAEEREKEIGALKLSFATEKALMKAGARNIKAVGSLLEREKISLDETGNLIGADEQIEAIKQSDPYLFEGAETAQNIQRTEILGSFSPEESIDENASQADFSNMTYSQITEYLERNKD